MWSTWQTVCAGQGQRGHEQVEALHAWQTVTKVLNLPAAHCALRQPASSAAPYTAGSHLIFPTRQLPNSSTGQHSTHTPIQLPHLQARSQQLSYAAAAYSTDGLTQEIISKECP